MKVALVAGSLALGSAGIGLAGVGAAFGGAKPTTTSHVASLVRPPAGERADATSRPSLDRSGSPERSSHAQKSGSSFVDG